MVSVEALGCLFGLGFVSFWKLGALTGQQRDINRHVGTACNAKSGLMDALAESNGFCLRSAQRKPSVPVGWPICQYLADLTS